MGQFAGSLVPGFIADQHAKGNRAGRLRATALFTDISGFTELTERLMSQGREGAEELALALRFYFDPLATAVRGAGGFITGFAGDGFLTLFPDAPSWDQALLAALEIRSFFERHPVHGRAGETFAFNVKSGLAEGEIAWGISVSETAPATYWFRGDPIDRCCLGERLAQAGEILVDEEMLPHLSRKPKGSRRSGFVRVEESLPGSSSRKIETPPPVASAPFVPATVLTFPMTGEFREVVRVFLGFRPSIQMDAFLPLVSDLAREYGGYFSHPDFGDKGGSLLILFGAPVAHERDAERAVRFLLALRASRFGPKLRAAVTSDTGYAGFNGGADRLEFTCLGRATNLAARIMMQVPFSEVYCSEAVAARCREFSFQSKGRIALKGLREPLPVFALLGRRREDQPHHLHPVVGRELEAQRLERIVSPIFNGRPAGIVWIDGEAGAGKTMLVQNLRRSLASRPHQWIEARCDPVLRSSLHPFAHALRLAFSILPVHDMETRRRLVEQGIEALLTSITAAPDELREDLARAHSMLGAPLHVTFDDSPYEQADPDQRLAGVIQAICRFVEAHCWKGATVLFIDDAHALDEESSRCLAAVAAACAEYPIAILLASRPRDDGASFRVDIGASLPDARLSVGGLDREGLAALVKNRHGSPPSDPLLDLLSHMTEGNPFFAEQLLEHLAERRMLATTERGLEVAANGSMLPNDVKALLVARLDRLLLEVKKTVQAAAVIGREFDVRILSRTLLDDPHLPSNLDKAERERIFSPLNDLFYLFRHALLCDAAYEMQAKARVRDLHRAAAEAIELLHRSELSPHYAALARHWQKAGETNKAAHYYWKAALQASASYAHDEAERLLRAYISLVPSPSKESIDAWSLLAGKILCRRRHDDARAAMETAIQQARELGDRLREGKTIRDASYLAMVSGRLDDARRGCREAIAILEETKAAGERAMAVLFLAILERNTGHPAEARSFFEEAIDGFRQAGNRRAEGITLTHLASLMDKASDDDRRAMYEAAASIAMSENDPRHEAFALASLAKLHYDQGRLATGNRLAAETLAIHRRMGNQFLESVWLSNFALSRYEAGDPTAVEADLETALVSHRRRGDRLYCAETLIGLGTVLVDRGLPAAALDLLREAEAIGREIEVHPIETKALVAIASAHAAMGETQAAIESFDRSLAAAPGPDVAILVKGAEIMSRLQDWERAAALLDQAAPLIGQATHADRIRFYCARARQAAATGSSSEEHTAKARELSSELPPGPLLDRVSALGSQARRETASRDTSRSRCRGSRSSQSSPAG